MSTELKNIVNHIVYDRQEEAKAEFTKYIEIGDVLLDLLLFFKIRI